MSADLSATDLLDGSGRTDPTCDAIKADRSRYGRVMWLFGDSIFRGTALGNFPDKHTQQQAENEPLWGFRSPASMINLMLKDYGLLQEDHRNVIAKARYVSCYAGPAGPPNKIKQTVAQLETLRSLNLIQAEDTVVFLNAGLHTKNPDLYQAQWRTILTAAKGIPRLRIVLCDTFDNLRDRDPTVIGDEPINSYRYDVGFPSSSGRPLSHNEATRLAFDRTDLRPSQGIFLPLAALVREWSELWMLPLGPGAYARDQIHLNVWGQLRLAAILLGVSWPELRGKPNPSIEQLVLTHWDRLCVRSQITWSSQDSIALVRDCCRIFGGYFRGHEIDQGSQTMSATASWPTAPIVGIIQELRVKNLELKRLIEKESHPVEATGLKHPNAT